MTISSKTLGELIQILGAFPQEDRVALLEQLKDPALYVGNMQLSGIVFSKYRTIDAFADAIGWTKKKALRVIANRTPLSREEMVQIIDHFELPPEAVTPLFFGAMFA